MDEIDKISLLADLGGPDGFCCLKHAPDDHEKNHPAVDYIVIPMGTQESPGIETQENELTIGICKECADGMLDPEWCLVYCFSCNENQWILKPISRLDYTHKKSGHSYNLILLNGCPYCAKPKDTKNGIYFMDIESSLSR
jgi:hypothetical protein